MVSKNTLTSNVGKKGRKGAGNGSSNPGINEDPVDAFCLQQNDQQYSLVTKLSNDAELAFPNPKINLAMYEDMNEDDAKLMIFLMEGERGFSKLELREMMTEVIKRSDYPVKRWFYRLGIEDKLPGEWKEFKEKIIKFCCRKTIHSVKKFLEEDWSKYISRLQEWCMHNNCEEDEIFSKLKVEKVPKDVQMILVTNNGSIKDIITRIENYESWKRVNSNNKELNQRFMKQHDKIREDPGKRKIVCFKCKGLGHKSYECKSEEAEKDKFLNNLNSDSIERRNAEINRFKYLVLFDTGSSINVIHKKMLEKVLNPYTIIKTKEYISLLNGQKMEITGEVILKIKYNNRIIEDLFKVYETGRLDIIIGNPLVKKLEEESSLKMPVRCEITTPEGAIVNWTRPIKNRNDFIEFQQLVDDLEKANVVEESKSLWLNPVVLIRKKTGKLRFCVDFRRLNELVIQDEYPLPKIQNILSTLGDKRYFSVIDLKDGFFNVEIEKKDRIKTAFYSGRRLMHFIKMPQGYKNSPGIFQRSMDIVFKDLIGKSCVIYIDDILIFGKDKMEHDRNFNLVMQKLIEYNLQENIEKRIYFKERVCFLGYEIAYNILKPRLERMQGINDYKTPKTKKDVQRFLGVINYDRIFIKDLAKLTVPLLKLTEKNTKFEWKEEHQVSFEEIKKQWKDGIELIIPDWNKNFVLEADASDQGLGAVLKQDEKPVTYISRVLHGAEKNYSITEKEVLAALWAMEKLQYYLAGKKFILVTDHKAIESLKSKRIFGSKRIQRWFERLEEFQFEVIYKKGEEMIQADAMSRAATVNTVEGGEDEIELQEKILQIHKDNSHRKNLKKILNVEYKISNKRIKEILKKCEKCARKDANYIKTSKHVLVENPGDLISMDLMEYRKGIYIIMAIDFFSRKLFAKIVKKKEVKKILELLEEIYRSLNFKKILTDNGKEFCNKHFTNWCKEKNVTHEVSIPYYHQGNGRIERANRTIRTALKKAEGKLRERLEKSIKIYNSVFHRGIGMSPEEALIVKNYEKVRENALKYSNEFKERKMEKFKTGDSVLIRNENKRNKNDDEFKEKGLIKAICGDKYKVKSEKGSIIFRHATQLRRREPCWTRFKKRGC